MNNKTIDPEEATDQELFDELGHEQQNPNNSHSETITEQVVATQDKLESLVGGQILETLNHTLQQIINPQIADLQQQIHTLQQKMDSSDQTFQSLGDFDSHPEFIRAILESYQQFSIAIQQINDNQKTMQEYVVKTYNILDTIKENINPHANTPSQKIIQLLTDIKQGLPHNHQENHHNTITPKKSFFSWRKS